MARIPFQERKTPLRAALDLTTGAYPGFLFGRPLGKVLPVFHFHDVTREYLEPYFAYLAENGYEAVTAEVVAQVARGDVALRPKMVALCFDDAWASFWADVLPLLEQYQLCAITYVAPGRIEDADCCRAQDGLLDAEDASPPFVTWPELVAVHESGRVDVQAHTQSHAMIFFGSAVMGFVTPQTQMPLLSWPQYSATPPVRFVSESRLGAPLFPQRSRMSDAHRYSVDEDVQDRCCRYVSENGGVQLFEQPEWEQRLQSIIGTAQGTFESDNERDAAIRQELDMCRTILSERLSKPITQICMPWAVCGQRGEALAREVGFESVVADSLFGKRYVYPGSNPYRIMRLKHQYIFTLPGAGRRSLLELKRGVGRG
jgi:hypothetical protein